jgi:hypothetical protein
MTNKLYTHKTYQNYIDCFIEDHNRLNRGSHFFDSETLKFFGEKRSTMKILQKTEKIKDISGKIHECYVLSSLQKTFTGNKKRHYTFFDIDTLKEVITM